MTQKIEYGRRKKSVRENRNLYYKQIKKYIIIIDILDFILFV